MFVKIIGNASRKMPPLRLTTPASESISPLLLRSRLKRCAVATVNVKSQKTY